MPLRDAILTNFWLKLVSLTGAALIWFTIYSSLQGNIKSSEDRVVAGSALTFPLPITVITAAADTRGFIVRPSEVEVTVRGTAAVLDRLKQTDVQVFVNLVGVKETRGLRKKILVHTPGNVTLVKVSPEEVMVERAPALSGNSTSD